MYFIKIIAKQLSCDSCRTCPGMLKWLWVAEEHLSLNVGAYKVYVFAGVHWGTSLELLGTSFGHNSLPLSFWESVMQVEKSPACQGMMSCLYGREVPPGCKNEHPKDGSWQLGCRQSEQELVTKPTKCSESLGHCHCKHNSTDPSSDPIFLIYYVSVWRLFQQFFWEVQVTLSLQGLQKSSAEEIASRRNVGGDFLDRISWLFNQVLLLSSQITFLQCLSNKHNSKWLCSKKLNMWSAKICPHNSLWKWWQIKLQLLRIIEHSYRS